MFLFSKIGNEFQKKAVILREKKYFGVLEGFQFFFLLGLAFYWNMRLDGWSDYKFTERSSPIEKQSFFRTRSVENSVLCESMENIKTLPYHKSAQFSSEFH